MNTTNALAFFNSLKEYDDELDNCETIGEWKSSLEMPMHLKTWFDYSAMLLDCWDSNEIELIIYDDGKFMKFSDYCNTKPCDYFKYILNENEMQERIYVINCSA